MSNTAGPAAVKRPRLNRSRVLDGAIALADDVGLEALSMRGLAERLGVAPMALYKHVAGKEQLVDAMVERLIGEIAPPSDAVGWRDEVRGRILSAREVLLRHRWAARAIETRTSAPPVVLGHIEALIGALRGGGFSPQLAHYAMHALGSRMWGFIQEVFPSPPPPEDPALREAMLARAALAYPHVVEIALAGVHVDAAGVVHGCDDQAEFEFALDLLLDGLERRRDTGWSPGS